MQDVEQLIIEWARDKGILAESDPRTQLEKTKEEINEFETELIKIDTILLTEGAEADIIEGLNKAKMELGDIFVTVIIIAELLGTSPEAVQRIAYDKISKRGGAMIDGLFQKND